MNDYHKKYPDLVKIWTILVVLLLSCNTQNSTKNSEIATEAFVKHDQIKLVTTQEGMYIVSLSDLGWSKDEIDDIALTHKGQPVPYWVEENDSVASIKTAGATIYGQPIANGETGEIIVKGPAILRHGGNTTTADTGVEAAADGEPIDETLDGTDEALLGWAIVATAETAANTALGPGYCVIFIDPSPYSDAM